MNQIHRDLESFGSDWNHLLTQIEALEEDGYVKDAYIDRLTILLNELCAWINSMEDQLCHCSEGKEKGREVIKTEEVIQELKYASEDKYQTAPNTRGTTIIKLLPIDLEGEIMVEGTSGCQECGVEDYPIIISDDEHTIPLQIQVESLGAKGHLSSECPLPEDHHIVSSQHSLHSSSPIHSTTHICSSWPSHIGGIGIHTKSGYSLVKTIKHHQRGEVNIP